MAFVGAALVLVLAAWFDNSVLRDAMRHASSTFSMSGVGVVVAIGSMLVAGSVLLVVVLAWRAASAAVGLGYAVVGVFALMLPWIVWNLATQVGDVPPVLPDPLLTLVSEMYVRTSGGSLNAVGTIGAAMLVGGVAALVRWQRDRADAHSAVVALPHAVGPTFP